MKIFTPLLRCLSLFFFLSLGLVDAVEAACSRTPARPDGSCQSIGGRPRTTGGIPASWCTQHYQLSSNGKKYNCEWDPRWNGFCWVNVSSVCK